MRVITFFCLLCLAWSCQTDQTPDIAALEEAVATAATPENQQQLLDAYNAFMQANPTDTPQIAQYLFKSINVHQQKGETDKSIGLIPLTTTMLAASLYDTTTLQAKPQVAQQYVATCELFAKLQPDNAEAPSYLFRAAETARTTKNFNKALGLYDLIYIKYPSFAKAPQALFLKGFTLDNDLKKHDEALAVYKSFLEKHPNDEFADDTQFLIENLGRSDDEIIKSFESEEEKK
ncbi:MAG: tetratricopeptide repeat protein [Bacteroidota bacterium]